MGKFGDFAYNKDSVVIPFHDVFFGVLGVIYVICDTITGVVAWSLGILLSTIVKAIAARDQTDDLSDSFRFFGYLQLVGWVTQFIGHGIFERKLILFY